MYILGNNHKVLRHGHLRVWAERGLIRFEDSRDNSFVTISVKECAERVNALNEMLTNTSAEDRKLHAHQMVELQRVISGYIDVMREAQEQGMPEDASARRDLVRRRPKTVFMPKVVDMDI